MPTHRGYEQAMNWLRSVAADKNSLDGVNAEICINVIEDLKRQRDKLGYLNGSKRSKFKEPAMDFEEFAQETLL